MREKNYKRNKLLLWAGILSILLAAGIILATSTFFALDISFEKVFSIFRDIFGYISRELIVVIIVLSCLLNLFLGITLIKTSKIYEGQKTFDKVVKLIVLFLLLLVTFSFLSAILVILAIILSFIEYIKAPSKPKAAKVNSDETKLKQAKQMLELNIISQEEYKKLTRDITLGTVIAEDNSVESEIIKLKRLKEIGVITEEEYRILIQKLL